jgi:IS5 family transposase
VADCTAADTLLDRLPATRRLHGDKGYDTDAVCEKIEARGTAPNIPPKCNRRWKPCFLPVLDRDRNAIERMFNRLKDYRAKPPGTTASPRTSSSQSASLQPSATGYESEP